MSSRHKRKEAVELVISLAAFLVDPPQNVPRFVLVCLRQYLQRLAVQLSLLKAMPDGSMKRHREVPSLKGLAARALSPWYEPHRHLIHTSLPMECVLQISYITNYYNKAPWWV